MADYATNGHHGDRPELYSSGSMEEMDVLSLRDILEIIWRNKWLVLAIFVFVAGAVGVYTLRQTPVYEASSTLKIDLQARGNERSLNQMLAAGGMQRSVQNEIQMLKSRLLARRVAQRLQEQADSLEIPLPILQPGEGRTAIPTEREIAGRLRSRILARRVSSEVNMIEITAKSTVPEEAALIANGYVDAYIEYTRDESRAEMRASRQFLQKQKERYEEELSQVEQNLEAFMEQEDVVALDSRAGMLVEQMAQLESLRDETQVELEMARASLETLREKADEIEPGLAERISSGLDREIVSLQQKKANLETQRELIYSKNPNLRQEGQSNPKLDEIETQIAALDERITSQARQYVRQVMASGGVSPGSADGSESNIASSLGYLSKLQQQITQKTIELNGREARMASITRRLDEYSEQFDQIPRKKIRLAQLERSRRANEKIYTFLVEKLQETRVAEQSELGYAELVDEALVPGAPISPNTRRNFILGVCLGLVGGVGGAFARNALDTRVHTPDDLEDGGISVVGTIPDLERQSRRNDPTEQVNTNDSGAGEEIIALHQPFSGAAEGYRQLQTAIQFSHPDKDVQVLLVTSAHPQEGKTLTAANLAVVMAQAGHSTVLVDGDLRRPRIAQLFNCRRKPGLVDLIFDDETNLDQYATGIKNLHIIPAGSTAPNPSELLGARKMEQVIDQLRETFEFIVIDSAPLLAVSDTTALASRCDASIALVSADETDREAVREVMNRLTSVGAGPIGAVLNRYTKQSLFHQYYGYGYTDYSYYNGHGKASTTS